MTDSREAWSRGEGESNVPRPASRVPAGRGGGIRRRSWLAAVALGIAVAAVGLVGVSASSCSSVQVIECVNCHRRAGPGHVCGNTVWCERCRMDVGRGHICYHTVYCPQCREDRPADHRHVEPEEGEEEGSTPTSAPEAPR